MEKENSFPKINPGWCPLFAAVAALVVPLTIDPVSLHASTIILTNSITISEANTNYDGQDLVISGATVTVDGSHSFASLLLTNDAVLTHSSCSPTETHTLDLIVTNQIVVSSNSRIDVSGKGYLAGRTTGNATVGGATGKGGGSHAGLGGYDVWGRSGRTYGNFASPSDWGSGGGSGPGGGLVKVEAGTFELDGQLLANGPSGYDGAGAGGGVLVIVNNLQGSGQIQA